MMNKSILLLQLCLLIITTRQVSGEETLQLQKCDLDRHYWCGDVCTGDWLACSCGNVTLSKYSSYYCCIDPGDSCTYDYIEYGVLYDDPVIPVCSRGQPVPRTQTCNGACPEKSPNNTSDAWGQITCDCPDEFGWEKCGDKCGYTWQCTQECDPTGFQWKCGDVCTFANWSCLCGNVTLGRHSPEYCCLEPGDTCTYDYINGYGNAVNPICSRGQPVPRSETCHGGCPEDSRSNTTDSQGLVTCNYNSECQYPNSCYISSECPYDDWHYMCGDVCTHVDFPCLCGNINITYWHTQHYCCLPPGDHCRVGYKKTECSHGEVVHRSKPCHGVCKEENGDTSTKTSGERCGYTDQCGWSTNYFVCGDICTRFSCTCGGVTLDSNSSDYCCTSQDDHCSYEYDDIDKPKSGLFANCANSTILSRSEQCHGKYWEVLQLLPSQRIHTHRKYHLFLSRWALCPIDEGNGRVTGHNMSWCGCRSL